QCEAGATEPADPRRDRDQLVESGRRMIVDFTMRLANVSTILVKIWPRLPLAQSAEIFGDADIGVDEIIGVEDDILVVDLVEPDANALLHAKIGKRHGAAMVGHRGLRRR